MDGLRDDLSFYLAFSPAWVYVVWSALRPPTDGWLLSLGGVSQLLGVVLIVIGVDDALRQLGKSHLARLWSWTQRLYRRLLGKGQTVRVSARSASHSLSTGRASVDLKKPERAMSDIERRLGKLEEAHNELQTQVGQLGEELGGIEERFTSKSEALEKTIEQLKRDRETATERRARWDLIGAALFFQGIILTTWAEGLALTGG